MPAAEATLTQADPGARPRTACLASASDAAAVALLIRASTEASRARSSSTRFTSPVSNLRCASTAKSCINLLTPRRQAVAFSAGPVGCQTVQQVDGYITAHMGDRRRCDPPLGFRHSGAGPAFSAPINRISDADPVTGLVRPFEVCVELRVVQRSGCGIAIAPSRLQRGASRLNAGICMDDSLHELSEGGIGRRNNCAYLAAAGDLNGVEMPTTIPRINPYDEFRMVQLPKVVGGRGLALRYYLYVKRTH